MFDTKKQLKWSKLKVGLVLTVGLLILVLAVFFAANIQNILTEKTELEIQFTDVMGLRKGAPVWILGIEEGSVKSIKLDPVHGVVVTVSVNRRSLEFVSFIVPTSNYCLGMSSCYFVNVEGQYMSAALKMEVAAFLVAFLARSGVQHVCVFEFSTIEALVVYTTIYPRFLFPVEDRRYTGRIHIRDKEYFQFQLVRSHSQTQAAVSANFISVKLCYYHHPVLLLFCYGYGPLIMFFLCSCLLYSILAACC